MVAAKLAAETKADRAHAAVIGALAMACRLDLDFVPTDLGRQVGRFRPQRWPPWNPGVLKSPK